MLRRILNPCIGLVLLAGSGSVWAFSLLGPPASWQTSALNFGWVINGTMSSLGSPQNLGEAYRWNHPTIYYAVDRSFLEFFGERGAAEIDKAVKELNDLPPVSLIKQDSYPLQTERINFQAQALGLFDLKTAVLQTLLQDLGVGDPEYSVFVLRNRWTTPATTNYYVIKRNFDPVTWQTSSYINGDLFSYFSIFDNQDVPISAVEYQRVDPLGFNDPVSTDESSLAWSNFGLITTVGKFYIGLTRDDIAALRYIYNPLNLAVETAPTNAFVGGFGLLSIPGVAGTTTSPWAPFGAGGSGASTNWTPVTISTNAGVAAAGGATNATNFIVNTALRPGIDHVRFVKIAYDSLLGQAVDPFLDTYVDTYITNGVAVSQTVNRLVTTPDIVFTAGDLFTGGPAWLMVARTQNWANDATLNRGYSLTGFTDGGPGTVQTPLMGIIFNSAIPAFYNLLAGPGGAFLSEDTATILPIWGSFDGTTNAPVVYPSSITLEQLEQRALGRP